MCSKCNSKGLVDAPRQGCIGIGATGEDKGRPLGRLMCDVFSWEPRNTLMQYACVGACNTSCMSAFKHIYIRSRIRANMHVRMHGQVPVCRCACIADCLKSYAHVYMRVHEYMCMSVYMQARVRARVYAFGPQYMYCGQGTCTLVITYVKRS